MTDLPKAGITRNIGDRGIIGDLRSCALVAHDATIDYFCWPDLDSPSVFAALLDSEQAGLFRLQPDWSDARLQQLYLPDTNILQTRWLSQQGVAEVTDYMPIGDDTDRMPLIVRRLQVLKGSANWRMRCAPMPDYARAPRCQVP